MEARAGIRSERIATTGTGTTSISITEQRFEGAAQSLEVLHLEGIEAAGRQVRGPVGRGSSASGELGGDPPHGRWGDGVGRLRLRGGRGSRSRSSS